MLLADGQVHLVDTCLKHKDFFNNKRKKIYILNKKKPTTNENRKIYIGLVDQFHLPCHF